MPPEHYARDYELGLSKNLDKGGHDGEAALSSLRYVDLGTARRANRSVAWDANVTHYIPWLAARAGRRLSGGAPSTSDVRRLAETTAHQAARRQFGHVHVWSPSTLVGCFDLAAKTLADVAPFRPVVADHAGHVGHHLQGASSAARRRRAGRRPAAGPAPEGLEYRVALQAGAGADAAANARKNWAELSRFLGRYDEPEHAATQLCCGRDDGGGS